MEIGTCNHCLHLCKEIVQLNDDDYIICNNSECTACSILQKPKESYEEPELSEEYYKDQMARCHQAVKTDRITRAVQLKRSDCHVCQMRSDGSLCDLHYQQMKHELEEGRY